MISQTDMGHLLEHRSRMLPLISRLGCAAIIILLLAAAGFYMWLFFQISEEPPRGQEVAVADLNGDGHLDAYVTISPGDGAPFGAEDLVLFGDGHGRFTPSDQILFNYHKFTVSLGDVNNDGMIDAVVGNHVYKNYNGGRFGFVYYLPREDKTVFRWQVQLADLNGDSALDLFGTACCGSPLTVSETGQQQPPIAHDMVWLNNGAGQFTNNGQLLGEMGSNAVALGDLNGDGSVDAFVVSGRTANPDGSSSRQNPNFVWLNDGSGQFSDSGQRLGEAESTAVALGDLDNDGDLDAVVGNIGRDELWLNDGQGNFSLSPQRFNSNATRAVFVADLNGDGNLDLVIAGESNSRVWLNEGDATFQSGQRIRHQEEDALALGDVNEDGLVDVFVAGVTEYQVWLGEGNGRFSAQTFRRQSYK